jgi:hypothetical protein
MTILSLLKHHSPSSLNFWQDSPGLWSLRYLGGVREDTSAAAARGIAVEQAMLQMLHGKKLDDAVKIAHDNFTQNMQGELSDDIDAEMALIRPMVTRLYEWNQSPTLVGTQFKVECWLDGVSLPLVGYVDFVFEDQPLLDLKTTKRIPSEPKPDHVRQVSLYMKARREPGSLLYVSEKRVQPYQISELQRDEAISGLQAAAISLERFLSRFTDAEDAIRCLPMNTDSFRFSREAKQKIADMHL